MNYQLLQNLNVETRKLLHFVLKNYFILYFGKYSDKKIKYTISKKKALNLKYNKKSEKNVKKRIMQLYKTANGKI